jgi:hypothetical protein
MLISQQLQTNGMQPDFVIMQLSYSTADIEKSIFYTAEYAPFRASQPPGNTTLLAVHGEIFVLKEDIPQPSIPFTDESGLFRIVGLDQQA